MSKQKQLIVLTKGSYPYGGAATNRHLSYLKGLVELGIDVKIIILYPDNAQSKKSNKNTGKYNGIRFQYIIPVDSKSKGFYQSIQKKVLSIWKGIKFVKKIINTDKFDTRLLVLVTDPFEIIPFLSLAKRKKIKTFHERTEFPFINTNTFLKKMRLHFYLRIVNKFDGLFVITEALKSYFTNYISPDKLFHIPMTVEPERFKCFDYSKSKTNAERYIAYCGSMYSDKDGVPILIKAFDIFAEKFPNINLVLIGDNSNAQMFSPIKQEIEKAHHKESIILTGKVDRDKMPKLLCNAEALALARPNNIQAKGGFPTKLGEYLATGNPVVVTAVGEIPYYLKDNESAFISEPDSPVSFANSLIELFTDKEKAFSIGKNGQKLTLKEFNYLYQANRLKHFLFV